MNSKLEKLRVRMHDEESAKPAKEAYVAKSVKAAKIKPVAPPAVREDSPVDIAPLDKMSLIDDCMMKLTPEEAADPANVIRTFNLFVFDEVVRYRKRNFFKNISDRTLTNWVALQRATNVKVARILTHSIVDAFESSNLNDKDADGSAGRRLRQLEDAIAARQGLNPTRGTRE